MGGGASAQGHYCKSDNSPVDSPGFVWQPIANYFDRKNKYVALKPKGQHGQYDDFSDGKLEFRVLLDEPMALASLSEFCSDDVKPYLECWKVLNDKNLSSKFDNVHAILTNMCTNNILLVGFISRLDEVKSGSEKDKKDNSGNNGSINLFALNDSTKSSGSSKDNSSCGSANSDASKVSSVSNYVRAQTQAFLRTVESQFHDRIRNRWMKKGADVALEGIRRDIIMTCFNLLYQGLYLPFTLSPMYDTLYKALQKVNTVSEKDFDFFHRLGSGGYGSIFTCRKRSTGAIYAMKIQPKALLLRTHKNSHIGDVMIEELATTSCRHPYICEAEYAFQSPKLVFLALPIYACGDLRRALLGEITGYFNRERARFYIAVVASVLMYLHSHGLIYRDLKPENLLLHSDGHIALCDLGSIADGYGHLNVPVGEGFNFSNAASFHSSRSYSLLGTAPGEESQKTASEVESSSRSGWQQNRSASGLGDSSLPGSEQNSHTPVAENYSFAHHARGKGVFGTMAYMAPEVISQFADKASLAMQEQYTNAVDWFSLGVLAHEFLLGKKPFAMPEGMSYRNLFKTYPDTLRNSNFDIPAAFTAIFGPRMNIEGEYNDLVGPDGSKLLDGLLTLEASQRLGVVGQEDDSYTDEFFAVKNQAFFRGIDWELLNQKLITPPFIPDESDVLPLVLDNPATCDDVLANNKLTSWAQNFPGDNLPPGTSLPNGKSPRSLLIRDVDQKFFRDWHFVHPRVIQMELLASHNSAAVPAATAVSLHVDDDKTQ